MTQIFRSRQVVGMLLLLAVFVLATPAFAVDPCGVTIQFPQTATAPAATSSVSYGAVGTLWVVMGAALFLMELCAL